MLYLISFNIIKKIITKYKTLIKNNVLIHNSYGEINQQKYKNYIFLSHLKLILFKMFEVLIKISIEI